MPSHGPGRHRLSARAARSPSPVVRVRSGTVAPRRIDGWAVAGLPRRRSPVGAPTRGQPRCGFFESKAVLPEWIFVCRPRCVPAAAGDFGRPGAVGGDPRRRSAGPSHGCVRRRRRPSMGAGRTRMSSGWPRAPGRTAGPQAWLCTHRKSDCCGRHVLLADVRTSNVATAAPMPVRKLVQSTSSRVSAVCHAPGCRPTTTLPRMLSNRSAQVRGRWRGWPCRTCADRLGQPRSSR